MTQEELVKHSAKRAHTNGILLGSAPQLPSSSPPLLLLLAVALAQISFTSSVSYRRTPLTYHTACPPMGGSEAPPLTHGPAAAATASRIIAVPFAFKAPTEAPTATGSQASQAAAAAVAAARAERLLHTGP